jgi:hypothetical protein
MMENLNLNLNRTDGPSLSHHRKVKMKGDRSDIPDHHFAPDT